MKIIGGLLIAFGLVDMIGSYTGLDVWGEWFHLDLPEVIWSFTAYIELGLGFYLFNQAGSSEEDEFETAASS